MDNNLSREALDKIDKMVVRVARKSGYIDRENITYKEHLQAKYEQQREKIAQKINKYRNKLSMKPSKTDFAEEIKTYLKDGLIDLMEEGYSEEAALKITMEKFDEAELNESFEDFVKAFGGFGMDEYKEMTQWYTKNGEAIGLFYAAFTILGMAVGTLCGYLLGHTLFNTALGFGIGLFVGVGLGLFSHAIIALTKNK